MYIVALLFCSSICLAQDSLLVFVDNQGQLCVSIEVEAGTTLYSVATKTGNSVAELMALNNKKDSDLSIGETIIAPLNTPIHTNIEKNNGPVTSILYRTAPGDNLFRISQLAAVPLNHIVSINQKAGSTLDIDEHLILGWIGPSNDKSETIQRNPWTSLEPLARNTAFLQMPSSIKQDSNHPGPFMNTRHLAPVTITERGIAYWEKKEYEGEDLIVMHPRARLNSDISLYNPMLNRTVKAKVVRELPREAYPKEISIVISPSVASALGALDKRFLVEITYIE